MSNKLEQLEFKLKKKLGFRNIQEKVRKNIFLDDISNQVVIWKIVRGCSFTRLWIAQNTFRKNNFLYWKA